jgi:putative peptidoglycan lipid II flippase
LIGHSGVEILTRAFYGMHDTRTPVLLGIVSLVLNLILSLSLIGSMQIAGLALANTVAALTEMTLLAITLRERLGGLEDRRIVITTLKTIAAALVMSIGVLAFLGATKDLGSIVRGLSAMLIGASLFAGAAWLLRVEELRRMIAIPLSRLNRDRE